jgi:hypothetical protein
LLNKIKVMSLRDTVKEWLSEGKEIKVNTPLCSKRKVTENLSQILELLEENSPIIATERIKWLISDIENGKLDPGQL